MNGEREFSEKGEPTMFLSEEINKLLNDPKVVEALSRLTDDQIEAYGKNAGQNEPNKEKLRKLAKLAGLTVE